MRYACRTASQCAAIALALYALGQNMSPLPSRAKYLPMAQQQPCGPAAAMPPSGSRVAQRQPFAQRHAADLSDATYKHTAVPARAAHAR